MNTRRKFLQTGATLLAAGAVAPAQQTAPSDRVRFGMIGIGMQGSGLLADRHQLCPASSASRAADLYDGRHTLAREITGNPSLPTTRRYQELLDRKDIDCIVAAVPDHWHKRVVVDACNAGKDIYCEKPMSHTAAAGFRDGGSGPGRTTASCRSARSASAPCFAPRPANSITSGAIGDVEMVELSLGRNDPTGAWEYPPPFDLSPENLDWDTWLNDAPKIPFDKIPLRALALLERVRHRRGRRPDGPPDQRHAVHARLERAAALGFGAGRHLPLEGRPQHAGPARGAVRLPRHPRLRPPGSGHGDA